MALLHHRDPAIRELARSGISASLRLLLAEWEGSATRTAWALGLNQAQSLYPLIDLAGVRDAVVGHGAFPAPADRPT